MDAHLDRTPSLRAAILARRAEDPGRPSIAFVDARGSFRWQSRAAFLESAERAAGALVALGLEPGAVGVVVSVEPPECATSVLAMLLLGAAPLCIAPPAIQGLNSSLREVLRDVVRRSGARVVVLPGDMETEARELREAHPGLRVELGFERLLADAPGSPGSPGVPSSLPDVSRAPDDVVALQLTSGTTGVPRIAVWHERRVLAALAGMARGMAVQADDVYLNWTPLYHDMGLVNNFLFCQAHGLPLALLRPLDVVRRPALWLRALDATGATTTWSPNFGYALAAGRVRDAELEGVKLEHVRGFWNAAERVHLETFRRFHARFERLGVRWEALKTNFGCVETIGGVTFSAPDGPLVAERVDQDALQREGVARVVDEVDRPGEADASAGRDPEDGAGKTAWIVSCGRPYPGLEIEAFGPDSAVLPDGVVGEIGIRGTARLERYLDQPAETAAALRGERVFPGDLGYTRGGELFWTGRRDERINVQGRKLDPSELERVLFAVEGLRKGCFVAFGLEDARRGTEGLVVLAEVEADAAGAEDGGWRAIAERARRDVATQLGLSVEELALVARGTLTKTSSGKRRHRHFRDLWREGALEVLHRSRAGQLPPAGA